MGRPSLLTPEIADEICNRLSGDESLVGICKDEHMPHFQTVFRWVREDEVFRADYARARELQGHTAADGLSDIRKAILSGEIDHQVGTAVAKIAQWEAARRAPKDFGDKHLVGSDPDNPLPQGFTVNLIKGGTGASG